ncbi:hypothetical protein [Pseudoalteromonas sp. T1lg22]|uniref:hypothetical protein n=1 Tax=Pseudoalteromonas sp. T1lg22 TaxID=2077096 RepID=UPI000CF68D53|nr:hypothetical protein [Pseudoalteromonas sp. T1lg22]
MLNLNNLLPAALAVSLGLVVFKYAALKTDLDDALQANDTLAQSLASQKSHADYLAQSLALANQQNHRLVEERTLLNTLSADYRRQLKSIERELSESQTELEALRLSPDETTKQWANDCVPGAVVSVLKYATSGACSQNGGTD